jgi:hypothetical protein
MEEVPLGIKNANSSPSIELSLKHLAAWPAEISFLGKTKQRLEMHRGATTPNAERSQATAVPFKNSRCVLTKPSQ